jgi:Ty3 transposon capsid-like protein
MENSSPEASELNQEAPGPQGVGYDTKEDTRSTDEQSREFVNHLAAIRQSIPEFNGCSLSPNDFIDFCRKTDEYVSLAKLPPKMVIQFIVSRLRELAAYWFETHAKEHPEIRNDWDALKGALRERFFTKEIQQMQMNRVLSLRQNNGDIHKFVNEFLKESMPLESMEDSVKVGIFLAALDKELRESIEVSAANIQNFNLVTQAAIRLGSKLNITSERNTGSAYYVSQKRGMERYPRRMNKLPGRCWLCHRPGHHARNCRSRDQFDGQMNAQRRHGDSRNRRDMPEEANLTTESNKSENDEENRESTSKVTHSR